MATNPENNVNHDKSGQPGPSPREYTRHRRHDTYARDRHSQQENAFLAAQAARLSSTAAVIFAKLTKYGSARVKAATNLSQLP